MMLNGWRLPLRLAFRDMRRYKGRSVLASLLIFLPAFIVAATLCGVMTWRISPAERADMTMVNATGQLDLPQDVQSKVSPLPGMTKPASIANLPTPASINAVTHGSSAMLVTSSATLTQSGGSYSTQYGAISGDLKIAKGWLDVIRGHAPTNKNEVVVTQDGRSHGLPDQGEVTLTGPSGAKHTVAVVGVVTNNSQKDMLGLQPLAGATAATVLLNDPSSASAVAWEKYGLNFSSKDTLVHAQDLTLPEDQFTSVFLATIILTGLALIAAPAFAASANRSRRTLALISINGSGQHVLQRVVLAQACLLGSLSAALAIVTGSMTGLLAANYAYLVWPDQLAGPAEVPVRYLLSMWVLSTLASLIAAFVPALAAGRTNVLQALRGQVSSRKVRTGMPVLGAALLAAGLGLIYLAAKEVTDGTGTGTGKVLLGIPAYFAGCVMLIPAILLLVGKAASILPVSARIAVRDVSRQRTRATAAVAAVLATTAALSTILIFGASYDAHMKRTYVPSSPYGTLSISLEGADGEDLRATVAKSVHEVVPNATITPVKTFTEINSEHGLGFVRAYFNAKSCSIHDLANSAGGPRTAQGDELPVTVFDGTNPGGFTHLNSDQKATLDDGGMLVVLDRHPRAISPKAGNKPLQVSDIHNGAMNVTVAHVDGSDDAATNDDETQFGSTKAACTTHSVKATTVYRDQLGGLPDTAAGSVIMLTKTAKALGTTPRVLFEVVAQPGGIPSHTTAELTNRFTQRALYAGDVEHGYHSPIAIILAFVAALAAIVILMTTAIAALLNQAEAAADTMTLRAAGASRGMARKVAAFHAIAIGVVGGIIGTILGFGPGAVLSYLNTTHSYYDPYKWTPIVEIPWQYLGIVILVVPLVAGLVIALTVPRSPEITRRTV